ncbi:hypothetical protein [Altererythrobacter sp. TH136]|uniref:hypothetical protein n=1 Tax=Altererythrobacter sp. TH136 TaxID=2067415 RepID=UPI0011646A92|nr:hypothetical protein [Altererythrobacter sp. TH136]QDM40633.1 hypothetical protein C0V74_05935 [Altererythrobacter sp. TH136]
MTYVIYDDATLEAALATPLDANLRDLVNRIVSHARMSGLWGLTCIAVLEPVDGKEDLEQLLGFDPMTGPLGDADGEFTPWWDWLEHHPGYFEVLHTTGTEFAYFVLVPDFGPDPAGLAELCRRNSGTLES